MRKCFPHLAILGILCLLTVATTWPLITQMSTHLAGDDVDVMLNPWADWWTKKALTEGLDFYYTDYIFYPGGASLVFHSFSHIHTGATLLLAPLIGYFAAYNVAILLTRALSGFGMYLLAHRLIGSRPAAFIAGLVFAFCPYHIFQSSHPVLITTQFIPLFALALIRILHDADLSRGDLIKQIFLATVWFLLTALSSWLLMIMVAGWTILYIAYARLFERNKWTPGTTRSLILLALLATLAILPFLWPVIREHAAADASYMTVQVEEGRSNDLLSFLTPTRLHPVFASLAQEINVKIGYTRNSPAYLGYVALGLGIVGAITARRQARFWYLTCLLFFGLSLGAQVKWCGTPLHTFHLPWAIPIIGVLRHPFRLNLLLFFSLAILVGFGAHWLFGWIASRSKTLARFAPALLAGILLFEYWSFPFPTTKPDYSPFVHQLAQEEGDFAVADFPMGRQQAKYYMFQQTIHGKKIVDGHISRTPHDAYAFVDGNPLLGALRNENVPPDYIRERLAVLAAQDVRYIIVHKHLLDPGRMDLWRKWLVQFPPLAYEDDMVIVYSTAPTLQAELVQEEDVISADVRLGDHIHLRGYRLSPPLPTVGDTLGVTLLWQSDGRLDEEYHVFVHLLDMEGRMVAQHDGLPVYGERPTWSWWPDEVIEDEHVITLENTPAGGTLTLSVGLYDYVTGARLPVFERTSDRSPDDRVILSDIHIQAP